MKKHLNIFKNERQSGLRQDTGKYTSSMFCHFFAEGIITFVASYGKELLQILHLVAGDTPEPRTSYAGPNQAIVAAEFSKRTWK